MFENIYHDRRVLVTGHTGFKGSWLCTWLSDLGATVAGFSIDVPTEPSHFEALKLTKRIEHFQGDVRDKSVLKQTLKQFSPEIVFHLAAQSLVGKSYEKPLETFSVNAIGTANILESLIQINKKVTVVMITSDKAYDNVEWGWGYRETDRLGGKDPYSASKGMAEIVIRSYNESYFKNVNNNIRVSSVRAGNVIGGGDWAEDRIVPDCVKAWALGKKVDIRRPDATRPWQHVLEPLSGYLSLAEQMVEKYELCYEAYNFGPPSNQDYNVRELINQMAKCWSQVRWNDVSLDQEYLHEAGLLKLNCDKALSFLGWVPTLNFDETVQMTIEWYKFFYLNEKQNKSTYTFTTQQINRYEQYANDRGVGWAIND